MRPEVGQRLVSRGLHDRAAVLRRQEAGIPVLHAIGAVAAVVGEHDKGRQVVVHRAERVAHPAAGAREAGQHEAGRLQERGRGVHPGGAHHVVDERHLVGDVAERHHGGGKQFAALAIGLEIPDRLQPRAEAVLKCLHRLAKIARLPVVLDEVWLVVPEVDVAGRPRHEELHHPFYFRRIDAGRVQADASLSGAGSHRIAVAGQHRRQCQRAKAAARAGQQLAAAQGTRGRAVRQSVVGRAVFHTVPQSTKENSFRFRIARQTLARP